jgi:hypothetical protein
MKCKKRTRRLDREERRILTEANENLKYMRSAMIVNPRLRDLFEEAIRKQKKASCRELRSMLEKVHLLRDNVEWDEAELALIYHILRVLSDEFRKRCREMWVQYAKELAPKYACEMEEALMMKKIVDEPKKKKGN